MYLHADIIIEQAPPAVNLQHYSLLLQTDKCYYQLEEMEKNRHE